MWNCECDCGNTTIVCGSSLRKGHTRSCGCLVRETTRELNMIHGMAGTRIYGVWSNMKGRCYNPNKEHYCCYGGRGISVCGEWMEFGNFYLWAMENDYSDDLTIDRIDSDGDYEPSNCRFVTLKEQAQNKRNNINIEYDGKTVGIGELSEISGLKYETLRQRYHQGDRGEYLVRPIGAS